MLGGDCQAKGPGGARPGERCRKSAPDRVDPSPRVLTPSWLTSACQVHRSADGSLAGGRLRCGARCDSGTPRPRREPLPTWESPELLAVLSSATWWSLWNCMVLSGSLKLLPRQPRPPSSSSPAARGSPPHPTQSKTPAPRYLPLRTYHYPTFSPPLPHPRGLQLWGPAVSVQDSAGTQPVLRFVDFPQVTGLRHAHRSLARCTSEPGRLASVPLPAPVQAERRGRGAQRQRGWGLHPPRSCSSQAAGRGARPAPPGGAAWHLAEGRAWLARELGLRGRRPVRMRLPGLRRLTPVCPLQRSTCCAAPARGTSWPRTRWCAPRATTRRC